MTHCVTNRYGCVVVDMIFQTHWTIDLDQNEPALKQLKHFLRVFDVWLKHGGDSLFTLAPTGWLA